MKYILTAIIGYLLGSTTLAILIGDVFFNRDVRNEGSGNLGAANVARCFGLKAALHVLVWDILKCLICLKIGTRLAGGAGLAVAGAACYLGHCFPCFHGFRGGKGVSVGAAIALIVSWKVFFITIGVFLLAAFLSRRVSVGSISAALALAAASFFLAPDVPRIFLGLFAGILTVYMHKDNIERLIHGEEKEFRVNK